MSIKRFVECVALIRCVSRARPNLIEIYEMVATAILCQLIRHQQFVVVTRVDIAVTVSTVCRKMFRNCFFLVPFDFLFVSFFLSPKKSIEPPKHSTEDDKGAMMHRCPLLRFVYRFECQNSVYLVLRMALTFQYLRRHARPRSTR